MSRHHRRRARVWPLAAALALATSAAAAAESTERSSSVLPPSLYLGTAFGFGSQQLAIDGRRQQFEGGGAISFVSARYAQGLLPHLNAVLLGRYGSEATEYSQMRGERRRRADLAIGPEFWWRVTRRLPTFDLRFAVSAGPTWLWIRPGPAATVTDEYATGHGFNVGGVLGGDLVWGHHGCYADLGAVFNGTGVRHTATLLSDPTVFATDKYRYAGFGVTLGVGYTLHF